MSIESKFPERYAALSAGALAELDRLLATRIDHVIKVGCSVDERLELFDAFGRLGFNMRAGGQYWRLSDFSRRLLAALPKPSPGEGQ